jgi:hypothetical protein
MIFCVVRRSSSIHVYQWGERAVAMRTRDCGTSCRAHRCPRGVERRWGATTRTHLKHPAKNSPLARVDQAVKELPVGLVHLSRSRVKCSMPHTTAIRERRGPCLRTRGTSEKRPTTRNAVRADAKHKHVCMNSPLARTRACACARAPNLVALSVMACVVNNLSPRTTQQA